MSDPIRAGYNFSRIFELSVSKTYTELPSEWECVNFRSGPTTQCICSRSIKHAYHYINRLNGNTIRVGTGCVRKLILKEDGEGNTTNRFIVSFISLYPGEYTNIYDLLRYSEQSRKDMLDIIETTLLTADMKEKRILLARVKEIHEIFLRNKIDCSRIQAIYESLDREILAYDTLLENRQREAQQRKLEEEKRWEEYRRQKAKEEEKRQEEERLRLEKEAEIRKEQERKQKVIYAEEAAKWEEYRIRVRDEQAAIRREQEERARLAKEAESAFIHEQLEQKLKAKELCECGLTKGEICRCEQPKFEVYRLNKQYVCSRCARWKDRCSTIL
jgi:flagellar biosynthesis GTPase FlhF